MIRRFVVEALVAAGLVMLVAAPVAAQAGDDAGAARAITSVSVRSDVGGAQVTFSASAPIVYEGKRVTDPMRLALWFPQTAIGSELGTTPQVFDEGVLAKVLVGPDASSPGTTKAALYLRQAIRIDQELSPDRRTLTITLGVFRADTPVDAVPAVEAPVACAMIEGASVTPSESGDGMQLTISASRPVTFEKRERGIDRMSVDIRDAVLGDSAPREVAVSTGGVRAARLAQLSLQPPVVRATLDLETSADHDVRLLAEGRTVAIALKPLAANAAIEVTPGASPPAPMGEGALTAALGAEAARMSASAIYTQVAALPKPDEMLPAPTAEATEPTPELDAPLPVPAPLAGGLKGALPAFDMPASAPGPVDVAQADLRPRRPIAEGPAMDPEAPSLADPGIRFPGTPLPMALQMLAYHYDKSVIVDESVQGSLALTLDEAVDFEKALGIITMMKDLAWKKVGDAYVVASKEKIQGIVPPSERTVTTYMPQMLGAASLVEVLGKAHPNVFAKEDKEAGIVILIGQPDEVSAALTTLRQADGGDTAEPLPAGETETGSLGRGTQVYALMAGDPQQMSGFVTQIIGDQVKITVQPGSANLVIQGPAAKVNQAVALLRDLESKTGERVSVSYTTTPAKGSGGASSTAIIEQALKTAYPYITVQPVPETDTLLLTGPQKSVDDAIAYARQLEQSGATWYDTVSEYISSEIDAITLARLATNAYPSCRFDSDLSSGRVIVMGPKEDVGKAKASLEAWDTPGATNAIPFEYAPAHADPIDLARMVNEQGTAVTAEVSQSGLTVILTGSPRALGAALTIVEAFDKPEGDRPAESDISVVVQLDHVDVNFAYETVNGYFEAVREGVTVVGRPAPTAAPMASVGSAAFGMPGAQGLMPGQIGSLVPGATAPPTGPESVVPGASSLKAGGVLAVVPDELSHRLTIVGPKSLVDRALALIEELDVPQHQVTMHAMIVDWDRTADSNVGTQWDFGTLRWTEHGSQSPFGADQITNPNEDYNSGIMFSTLDRGVFDFKSLLNFVKTNRSAKLLARPNVKALDGQQGRIQIGDELRFQVIQLQGAERQPIFTTETVDAGIILEFTPRIANDGTVTAKLMAEVSTISGYVQGIPQLSKREASTTVRLQDGQTMVIAGLIREDELKIIEKLPILGDIPFFGRLFQNRKITKRPQELLVFLTPQIEYADDPNLTAEKPAF